VAVLVDSSVWIAAAKPGNSECVELRRLIRGGELIHLLRPIQAEVCQGARTETGFHQLWDSLLGFDFLEVTDRHWGLAAFNYFRCRKTGLTLGTLDCLIGTVAADYRVELWTLDRTLKRPQTVMGFSSFKA
jgi:predicted nucleic acid-binding protein